MIKLIYNDNEYDLEKLSKYTDYFKRFIKYDSKDNFIYISKKRKCNI